MLFVDEGLLRFLGRTEMTCMRVPLLDALLRCYLIGTLIRILLDRLRFMLERGDLEMVEDEVEVMVLAAEIVWHRVVPVVAPCCWVGWLMYVHANGTAR